MSKGSKRRPRQVPYDQYAANWDAIFAKAEVAMCQACGKPPGECRCLLRWADTISPCQSETNSVNMDPKGCTDATL